MIETEIQDYFKDWTDVEIPNIHKETDRYQYRRAWEIVERFARCLNDMNLIGANWTLINGQRATFEQSDWVLIATNTPGGRTSYRLTFRDKHTAILAKLAFNPDATV